MRCRQGGCGLLAWVSLLVPVVGALPALPVLSNVSNALNVSEVFPVPDSDIALRFWAFGNAVDPWTLQSILIVSMAYLRDQISQHGDGGHPHTGGLEYDLGEGSEILIRKMPDDPDGLDWSELQTVIAGLWEYIVTGMRYRTVTFDVLDIEADAQIGWGHIVKLERYSRSDRTAKRGLQLSSLALPSSATPIPSPHNSSLSTLLNSSDWQVEETDMTLRFSAIHTDRGGRQVLDPETVRNLLAVVIEIIQNNIAVHGEQAGLGDRTFRYGRLVVLEVINWPYMLSWGHFATVVLGLVEFIVDHNHFRTWYFTIFVGEPMVEIGIGKIVNGLVRHDNVTVARRSSVDGDEAG